MVDFAVPYINGAMVYIVAREDSTKSSSALNQTFNAFLSKVGF